MSLTTSILQNFKLKHELHRITKKVTFFVKVSSISNSDVGVFLVPCDVTRDDAENSRIKSQGRESVKFPEKSGRGSS